MSIVICYPLNSASQFIGFHALANQYNRLPFLTASSGKFAGPRAQGVLDHVYVGVRVLLSIY